MKSRFAYETLSLTGQWTGSVHFLHSVTYSKVLPTRHRHAECSALAPCLNSASSLLLYTARPDAPCVSVIKTRRRQFKATKLLSLLSSPGATLGLSPPCHSDSGLSPPFLGLLSPVPNCTVSLPVWYHPERP